MPCVNYKQIEPIAMHKNPKTLTAQYLKVLGDPKWDEMFRPITRHQINEAKRIIALKKIYPAMKFQTSFSIKKRK